MGVGISQFLQPEPLRSKAPLPKGGWRRRRLGDILCRFRCLYPSTASGPPSPTRGRLIKQLRLPPSAVRHQASASFVLIYGLRSAACGSNWLLNARPLLKQFSLRENSAIIHSSAFVLPSAISHPPSANIFYLLFILF